MVRIAFIFLVLDFLSLSAFDVPGYEARLFLSFVSFVLLLLRRRNPAAIVVSNEIVFASSAELGRERTYRRHTFSLH